MNTFFSQLKKEAEEIRLTREEREAMHQSLLFAMQSSPLVKSPIQVTPSPYHFLFAPRALVPALALLLVVGVGSAYAAEGALPGDLLYPIKINVNEQMRTSLALSTEAKGIVHARFAERRMIEAETLSAQGALTEETKVELEENFNTHATKLESIVEAVEKDDPVAAADIGARFESALAAHSAVIAHLALEGGNEKSRQESGKFARALKERERKIIARGKGPIFAVKAERAQSGAIEVQTFAQGSEDVSASIVIRDADEGVIARIELSASTTLAEAEARFASLKDTLDENTAARVQAQISDIRMSLEKFRENGEGSSEKKKIERALKNAVMLKAFLEAQAKFRDRTLLPGLEVTYEDDENEDKESNTDQHESEGHGSGEVTLPINPPQLPL